MPVAKVPERYNANPPPAHVWHQPDIVGSPLRYPGQFSGQMSGPDLLQRLDTEQPPRALGFSPLDGLFPPGLGDIFGRSQSVGFSEALPDGTRIAVAVDVTNQPDGDGGQVTFSHTIVDGNGKPVPGSLRSLAKTTSERLNSDVEPKIGVTSITTGQPTLLFGYTTEAGDPILGGFDRRTNKWIEPVASPSEFSTLGVLPIGEGTFVIVSGDKLVTGPDSQQPSHPSEAHDTEQTRIDLPKELWLARVQNDGSLVFERMKGGEDGETLTDPQVLQDEKWGPMVIFQRNKSNMPPQLMASIPGDNIGPYILGSLAPPNANDLNVFAGIRTQKNMVMVVVHSGDTLWHAVGQIDPEAVALSTQEGEQQTDVLELTQYPPIPNGRIQSTRALGLHNGKLYVAARTEAGDTEIWALGENKENGEEGSMRLIGTHSLEAFGINPIPGEMVFDSGAIWAQLGYGENAKGYYGEPLLHTQFLPRQQSKAAAPQAGAVFAPRGAEATDNKSLNPFKLVREKNLELEPLRQPGQGNPTLR